MCGSVDRPEFLALAVLHVRGQAATSSPQPNPRLIQVSHLDALLVHEPQCRFRASISGFVRLFQISHLDVVLVCGRNVLIRRELVIIKRSDGSSDVGGEDRPRILREEWPKGQVVDLQ